MKRFFDWLIPHLAIVISLMVIFLFCFDRFNDAMAFLNNDITKILVLLLSIAAILLGVREIVRRHKK